MRASCLCLAAALLLPVLPHGAHAQAAPAQPVVNPGPLPAGRVASAAALDTARLALRALVIAQEVYFADHGTYTTDVAALRATGRLTQFPTIAFNLGHAGGLGWRGSARHVALRGKSCVTFVGAPEDYPMPATRAEQRRPAPEQEAQPVCDAP